MFITKYTLIIVGLLFISACGGENPDTDHSQSLSVGTSSGNGSVTGFTYPGTGVPGTGTVGLSYPGATCISSTLANPPQTNDQFLKLAYCQFFKRNPDDAGYTYWINQLNSGYPRLNVLLSFLLSGEAESTYSISTMSASNLVSFFYPAYLGRSPDAAGADYWVKRYSSLSGDKLRLAREFLSTSEPKNYWNM